MSGHFLRRVKVDLQPMKLKSQWRIRSGGPVDVSHEKMSASKQKRSLRKKNLNDKESYVLQLCLLSQGRAHHKGSVDLQGRAHHKGSSQLIGRFAGKPSRYGIFISTSVSNKYKIVSILSVSFSLKQNVTYLLYLFLGCRGRTRPYHLWTCCVRQRS